MGLTYTVEFDDAAVTGALDRLAALGVAPEGLLTILGDYGRESIRRRWLTKSAPDCTAWAGLSPGYALLKPAGSPAHAGTVPKRASWGRGCTRFLRPCGGRGDAVRHHVAWSTYRG